MENMSGIFKKGLTKSVFSGYTLFVLRQKFQVVTEGIYRKQPEDERRRKTLEDEYILKLCTEWQSCLVGCNGVALVIVLKYRKKAVLIEAGNVSFL